MKLSEPGGFAMNHAAARHRFFGCPTIRLEGSVATNHETANHRAKSLIVLTSGEAASNLSAGRLLRS